MKRDDWIVDQSYVSPVGQPGKCVYCGQGVGTQHGSKCSGRQRTVVIDVMIRMVRVVTEDWTKQDIEDHLNQGRWCADNILSALDHQAKARGCLCDDFTAHYVGEATEEDEEKYRVRI